MSDSYVTNIAQQALDAAGVDHLLGDIEDGTRPSQVCLRWYRQCLQQLLRAALWDFARKSAPLELLADTSGNTPNVEMTTPGGLFQYAYAYPTDCMKVRWIPWNPNQNVGTPPGNIVPPNNNLPILPPAATPQNFHRPIPARFLISNASYPSNPGAQNWEVQGVSPQGRTVILTNVPHAHAVYTFLCLYPNVWDALFREALVAYLASEIALPLATDKKLGLEMRNQQIAIAKGKIVEARAISGNEGWSTSDITVDWMRFRRSGGEGNWWGFGPNGGGGGFFGGLDGCCGAGAVVGGAAF